MNEAEVRALRERADRDALIVAQARAALARAGVEGAESVDLADAISSLAGAIADLEPRARAGDDWRASVTNEALEAGVRAYGNQFARSEYEEMFRAMSVKQVELMGKSWEDIARAKLPAGGRRTADIGTGAPEKRERANGVADTAQFVVGR